MSTERIHWGLDEQGECVRFASDVNGKRRLLTPTENADLDMAAQVRWIKQCKTMRAAPRKYESGTVRPRFTPRYLQYAAWAEGRDPGYAPTMADLLLLASERRARMGKPSETSPIVRLKMKPFTPPAGWVSALDLEISRQWRKSGKNPRKSTVDRWITRNPPKPRIKVDPSNGTRWFPPKWVTAEFTRWSPRPANSELPDSQ